MEKLDSPAMQDLAFYAANYDLVFQQAVGRRQKPIVLGRKPHKCRFCNGQEPNRTFRKRAHAISELLGNKAVRCLYECDDCNRRFSAFEDDLAKFTLPWRTASAVAGKGGRPVIKHGTGRMEYRNGQLHVCHVGDDGTFVVDEITNTATFSYREQPHRPLGVYKALCKCGFALLPDEELSRFNELKRWLLEPDVQIGRVYRATGHYVCMASYVPGFCAFPQTAVSLLRRKTEIDAPYATLFVALGNITLQIFLPCPTKDDHLSGKTINLTRYPHIYELKKETLLHPMDYHAFDLSSPERTQAQIRTIGFRYGSRIKVS
jgi:hypothetical protein